MCWSFFYCCRYLCLFCFVLLLFVQSSQHSYQNIVLTGVRKAQRGILHGERYTERDFVPKLRCSKTVVHYAINTFNADGTFHDRKRSGLPRKTSEGRLLNETEGNTLINELRVILLFNGNLSSQQRGWTEWESWPVTSPRSIVNLWYPACLVYILKSSDTDTFRCQEV